MFTMKEALSSPFSSLFEASLDAVLLTRADGTIIRGNGVACTLLGYSKAELRHLPRGKLIAVSDPRVSRFFEQQEKTGGAQGEFELRRKDASRFLARVSSAPFIDGNGTRCSSLTLRDLTEQRRMEQELQESEERYRSLMAALFEGIVMQDADGQIQACNDSAQTILGLTAGQISGRTAIDPGWRAVREDGTPFLGEEHPALLALKTGQPIRDVIMGVHKPDSVLTWIRVNANPLFREGMVRASAVVWSFVDITAAKRLEEELHRQARTDALTGIANRRALTSRAEADLSRAGAQGLPLSVLMMDVDHFKTVNDTYGHHVGDQVLQAVAARAAHLIRDIDFVARTGGEEFCVLLPNTDSSGAYLIAERLRQAFAAAPCVASGGRTITVTLSVGQATASGLDDNLTSLLSRADAALYEAKRSGRNCVVSAERR